MPGKNRAATSCPDYGIGRDSKSWVAWGIAVLQMLARTEIPFSVRLCLRSTLTVWFRSADGEKQNVEIAEDGHDQGIVQALSPDGSSVGLCVDEVAHFSDNPGDRSA